MSQKIGDLSVARPGGLLLRSRGYVGVIRYAALGRNDVNISADEVQDYEAHALQIGIVNEFQADYMEFDSGSASAIGAREVTQNAGLPDGVTYFAADFDITGGGPTYPGSPGDQNITRAARFLESAASAIGEENVGFYGGYFACLEIQRKTPWVQNWWQTEAWSSGMFFAPADLYQYARLADVPGVDRDAAVDGFWGQRGYSQPGLPPLSVLVLFLPVLMLGNTGQQVKVLQDALNKGQFAQLVEDGVFGPATMHAVENCQHLWRLKVDGIAGPQTDRAISFELKLRGD